MYTLDFGNNHMKGNNLAQTTWIAPKNWCVGLHINIWTKLYNYFLSYIFSNMMTLAEQSFVGNIIFNNDILPS